MIDEWEIVKIFNKRTEDITYIYHFMEFYDRKTITNYQSELRGKGYSIPRINKIKSKLIPKQKRKYNRKIIESDKSLLPTITHNDIINNIKTKDINENDEFSVICVKLKGTRNLITVLEKLSF